ncbi:hypothetical protein DPX39_100079000 [Trypanosoma brucei equiperdum]|uniref:Uncharacterized protein n=1 Tax=Trypanosoma brucei equiperdum TaxID=630700 RepID=A0A3L6L5Q9_9TRYP|nr:hypothetical protein DPX39_100079000 [Trypanosoma brucei equiperdum]
MFFVFPFPTSPRQRVERVMRVLYQLGAAIFVISYVVLLTEADVRLQAGMHGSFSAPGANLSDSLEMVMSNCEYEGIMSIYGVGVVVGVNAKSLPFAIISMLQHMRAVLVVQFLAALNGVAGGYCYSTNIRHMHLFGLHVPVHLILNVLAYVLTVTIIALVAVSGPVRSYYSASLEFCAAKLAEEDNEKLLESGFDGFHLFGTRLEWAMGAAIVNLIIYTIGLVTRVYKSHDPAIALFSMSDVPWERTGIRLSVDKAALSIHTAARERIISEARDAIGRGERVRIVRSYALMTEADYNEQVEEMRRLFATRAQEEQFKNMHSLLEDEPHAGGSAMHWGSSGLQKAEPLRPDGTPVVQGVGDTVPPFGSGMMGRGADNLADVFNVDNLSDLSLNRAGLAPGAVGGFDASVGDNQAATVQQWQRPGSIGYPDVFGGERQNESTAFGDGGTAFTPDALQGNDDFSHAFTNISDTRRVVSRRRTATGAVAGTRANGSHEPHNLSGEELWDVSNLGDDNALSPRIDSPDAL